MIHLGTTIPRVSLPLVGPHQLAFGQNVAAHGFQQFLLGYAALDVSFESRAYTLK